MSKLFLHDRGCVIPFENEEITRWRRVRKTFKLPVAAAKVGADLWLLLACYADNRLSLHVCVNGHRDRLIKCPPTDGWLWHRLPLGSAMLKSGNNVIELTCDTPAMNAWRLALDVASPAVRSAVSFDRGETWRRDGMGVHATLDGEYVIRLRSKAASLRDTGRPVLRFIHPHHPRLRELRKLLPQRITRIKEPWKQALALRSWVATRWSHDPFGPAICPWDVATILDWVRRDGGHGMRGKTAMCVHFGVMFACFAAALGHRARCIAMTSNINSMDGHFVAELFDAQRNRWIMHDANFDAHFDDGGPLSAIGAADRAIAGQSLRQFTRTGPGMPKGPLRITRAFANTFSAGVSYRLVAVWPGGDFLADPSAAPPFHGRIIYHEPQFVWYAPSQLDVDVELGMFPHRIASRDWFDKPPDA